MINRPQFLDAADGTRLSYRVLGEGRPLLLLHGFFSSGTANWIGNRQANLLTERGFRLVVPDLRGHGRSELPPDPAAYPADVLVDDALTLLAHLGIDDLDAAGYSLGARTVLRMLVRGSPIRRAVLGGQGLSAMTEGAGQSNSSFVRRVLDADGPLHDPVEKWFSQEWHSRGDADQQALGNLLASSVGTPLEQIRAISTPTLVIMGDRDDPADGRALATTLERGHYAEIAGDHVRAAGNPELAAAVVDFLDDGTY